MIQLPSKAQYKRSEKGEFHEIANRTVEETISLTLSFPWDTERSLASIELTCPSITIEHPLGTYLKISPYFSAKYSLYYLSKNQKIYLKTVDTLEDVCVYVKTYFEQQGELHGFKKYDFTMNPIVHFRTNPFIYTTDTRAALRFFSFHMIMTPLILFMSGLSYSGCSASFSLLAALGVILLLCLFIWSPLIYFYFNYLSADRDYSLQVSKGHDNFTYGVYDRKRSYEKQNIVRIDTFVTHSARSPWRECQVFTISFKDGEQLRFSSLLISETILRRKFHEHAFYENKKLSPTVESVGDRL